MNAMSAFETGRLRAQQKCMPHVRVNTRRKMCDRASPNRSCMLPGEILATPAGLGRGTAHHVSKLLY
eukprot:527010-Heterocapsa_arctica.AAC.1